MKTETSTFLAFLIATQCLFGCVSSQEIDTLSEQQSLDIAESTLQVTTLVRVVDGDTIVVSIDGKEERVRLVGIDTPEKGFCGFEEASEALGLLLSVSIVGLIEAGVDDRDRFGRLLRYLDIDGSDPGLELIRAGLATAAYDSRTGYPAHPREAEYVLADAQNLDLCVTD